MLRPRVRAAAEKKWGVDGNIEYMDRILEAQPGMLCCVIGTTYLDMPLKPSVMDEVGEEYGVIVPPPREKYVSEKDQVSLEDESGRVVLTGDLIKNDLFVSGTVIGVLGRETSGGDFEVLDVCYPECEEPVPIQMSENKWVAFVSGLSTASDDSWDDRLNNLAGFLTGASLSEQDLSESTNIVRMILCGNSLPKPRVLETEKKTIKKISKADQQHYDTEPLRILDKTLSDIGSSISVDLMPGDQDPTNYSIPQQPVHRSMFGSSMNLSSFKTVPNPYGFTVDGVKIMGTSGQNLDDIYRYMDGDDRLRMAEKTLIWSHLAPTAPDTLWCYPFKDEDPFVIESRPHIYFIGNQPKFETKLTEDLNGGPTRIILVPKFAETGMMVLVNLSNLDVKTIVFEKTEDEVMADE